MSSPDGVWAILLCENTGRCDTHPHVDTYRRAPGEVPDRFVVMSNDWATLSALAQRTADAEYDVERDDGDVKEFLYNVWAVEQSIVVRRNLIYSPLLRLECDRRRILDLYPNSNSARQTDQTRLRHRWCVEPDSSSTATRCSNCFLSAL